MINIKRIKAGIGAIALTLLVSSAAVAQQYTREFDDRAYLQQNPDVAEGIRSGRFKSAYDHYVRYGQHQNREGAFKIFDEQEYLRENPDVAEGIRRGQFKSAYDHYLKFGQYENRSGASRSTATVASPPVYNGGGGVSTSRQDLICDDLPGGWSQEAFFQTENRLINICRSTFDSQLVWLEKSRGGSQWNNYDAALFGDRFYNTTKDYAVSEYQFEARQDNRVLFVEPVINRWVAFNNSK
jgi:hypothetical protein